MFRIYVAAGGFANSRSEDNGIVFIAFIDREI